MIEFKDTSISNIVFHRIDNEDGKSFLSESEYSINQEEEEVLKTIFLKPFTSSLSTFEFDHPVDLSLNSLFKLAKDNYADEDFYNSSLNIYKHLKSVSKHPNINGGDLFIIKYDDVKINNSFHQALGIYKIENKQNFIETSLIKNGKKNLNFKKGIGQGKIDKACLIIFTEEPYTIFIIDKGNVETEYWQNDFINARLKNDHINSTSQFMSLTKTYVTEQFPNDYKTSKTDQIDLLNRSIEYFKTNDTFDKHTFESDVLQDDSVIESFRNFDKLYKEENNIALSDNFEISSQAVKKQARIFKSVLKLDKNFHVYIHGDKNLIEQGVEKDGSKYYKIYFKEES